MLISEAFRLYADNVIAFCGQSKKTEENHFITMRALIAFTDDIDIETLTFIQVRNWKQYLEKGRSAETVRNYIIKLRVVLAYLKKQGVNCMDYELIPVPKRIDKVPCFITKEEVTRMIDSCSRLRSKCVIALLYASGIRVNELCQLDRLSLNQDSFTLVGKGGKARLCFLDERTKFYLHEYLRKRTDNSPALFVSQTGARISATNVQLLVKTAARNAGITKHVTPHTLRHTFATEMLNENTNLRHVQVMLGHSSILTTQMYTHVVDRDLEAIYRSKHLI